MTMITGLIFLLSMEVSLIPCDGGTCAIVNAKPEDQADYVLVEVFFEQAATIEKKEVKLLLHHQVTVPMVAGAHVASDPMGVDMKKIVRMKYTTLKRGEVKEQKITP